MREKDAVSNVFFRDPARVADLMNSYIYQGRQIVRPKDVQARGERVYRIAGQERGIEAEEVTLDIVNEVVQKMQVTIVCLQNQSEIHYAMPVRIMNEEATRYHEEWKSVEERHRKDKDAAGAAFLSGYTKNDKLMPVITIVVYWGKKSWDGPKRLKEMLKLDECPLELQKFIVDYPIHLLEVRAYEGMEDFTTDLRYVFGFLRRDRHKEELASYVRENQEVFSCITESAYNLLSVMSRCDRLKIIKKNIEKEGTYNMCEAIEGIFQDGKEEGREEGRFYARNILFTILGKYGELSDELRRRIQREMDLDVLGAWARAAVHAISLEEFMQSIGSDNNSQ